MQRLDDALQPEGADEDAVADDRRTILRRLRRGRLSAARHAGSAAQPLADGVDRRAGIGAGRAQCSGRDQPRRATFGVRGQYARATLEGIDDRVDLPARIPHPFLDALVEPLLEGLFPVAQIVLARMQLRRVLRHRLALARQEPALVIEHLDVLLDLRQMLRQLRLALGAVRTCALDDRAGRPSRVAISNARLLPGDP